MLRPWAPHIVLNRAAGTAVYLQIVGAIIEEVATGRLSPGSVLPGTRDMAASLGVNRKTVVQAYDELMARGWLHGDGTRGTFVSERMPHEPGTAEATLPSRPNYTLRKRAAPAEPAVAPAGAIAFDDGLPDARLMPAALLARTYRRLLVDAARQNRLGYGDPRGVEALRQAVCTMLRLDRGIPCTPDNVCMVRGTQMGIYLAAQILVSPGDTVAVEELSYPPAWEAFRAAGATIETVALDGGGMRIEALEALCRRRRVRAVYVTPHHQFPTTVLMPPERRLHLLALAEQFGFAVVEDDYDHEFHFGHAPMLPLASADRWGRVIYIGSMSKLLSPALRVGYMVAPAEVIAEAAARIMLIDRQGDPTMERAVAELMQSGALKSHTRRALRVYKERRTTFAALVRSVFGDLASFDLPEGGLALWLRVSHELDVERMAEAGREAGVWFRPGTAYAADGRPVCALRLGFGSLDDAQSRRGANGLHACKLAARKAAARPRRDA